MGLGRGFVGDENGLTKSTDNFRVVIRRSTKNQGKSTRTAKGSSFKAVGRTVNFLVFLLWSSWKKVRLFISL